MECPVYVLDITDRVPIPNNDVLLAIDLETRRITTYKVEVGDQTVEYVALALPKDFNDFDSTNLATDMDLFRQHTHEIGVICRVLDNTSGADDPIGVFHLHAQARCYINSHIFTDDDGAIWSDALIVDEKFDDTEQDLVEDIDRMTDIILQNTNSFGQLFYDNLNSAKNQIQRMDILAEECIESDEERIRYLQTYGQFDRWLLLTAAISKKLKNANERRRSTKKVAKQKPEASKSNDNPWLVKLDQLQMPESTKEKIRNDINRLKDIPSSSLEHSLGQDYLRLVFSLPWNTDPPGKIDLRALREALNETHYGLEDVKEYLLEHVCMEQVRAAPTGAIMCLVGPPSTGKSSIAKALAHASGRKFHRISMGGVSDEAALRGARRTYVAARAGRIINAIKEAGTTNCLILLDEVDKIEHRRNAATAALLEVLDPDQNAEFVDRYLEIPFDLSQVLFVCTANYKDQIPSPLLSRMEIIEFRDYTEEERLTIIQDYLCSKVIADYHIEKFAITIDDAVFGILAKELQLRQIEKRLRRLLRKAVLQICLEETDSVHIDQAFLDNTFQHQVEAQSETSPIGFFK